MSAPERRLAIRRSFTGVSLVDELERLFIDQDRDLIRTPWPGVMPLVARTGEGEQDRCGHNCVDSHQLATQKKKTTTKKRLQVCRTKSAHSSQMQMCLFCRRNGEAADVYSSHNVKDEYGRVSCPVLFRYVCPICGATGAHAHTVSHCPRRHGDDDVCNVLALNTVRNSAGRRRYVRT